MNRERLLKEIKRVVEFLEKLSLNSPDSCYEDNILAKKSEPKREDNYDLSDITNNSSNSANSSNSTISLENDEDEDKYKELTIKEIESMFKEEDCKKNTDKNSKKSKKNSKESENESLFLQKLENNNLKEEWINYKGFILNYYLFKKGVLIIDKSNKEQPSYEEEFSLDGKKFKFKSLPSKKIKNLIKSEKNEQKKSKQNKDKEKFKNLVTLSAPLAGLLQRKINYSSSSQNFPLTQKENKIDTVLYSSDRGGEIFYPITISESKTGELGFYVYPVVPDNIKLFCGARLILVSNSINKEGLLKEMGELPDETLPLLVKREGKSAEMWIYYKGDCRKPILAEIPKKMKNVINDVNKLFDEEIKKFELNDKGYSNVVDLLPDKIPERVYDVISSITRATSFSGINYSVSYICMPGITVVDEDGWMCSVVKHDIKLGKGKIVEIQYSNNDPDPYGKATFEELNLQMDFIKKIAAKSTGGDDAKQNLHCYFHLPDYDYMLFGIELFIRGGITKQALNNFFKAITQKKAKYTGKIEKISTSHGFKCKIESPFDNLLGSLNLNKNTVDFVTVIFNALGVSTTEIEKLKEEERTEMEQKFVDICWEKLVTNTYNKKHQEVWHDFLKTVKNESSLDTKKEISPLERFLQIANLIIPALASKKQPGFMNTCLFYPNSEIPIANNFKKIHKFLPKKQNFYFLLAENDKTLTNIDKFPIFVKKDKKIFFYHSQNKLLNLPKQKISCIEQEFKKMELSDCRNTIKIVQANPDEELFKEISNIFKSNGCSIDKYPPVISLIFPDPCGTLPSTNNKNGLLFYTTQNPTMFFKNPISLIRKTHQNIAAITKVNNN